MLSTAYERKMENARVMVINFSKISDLVRVHLVELNSSSYVTLNEPIGILLKLSDA